MPDRMPRAAGGAKPRRSRLLWVGLPVVAVFAVFAAVVWLGYQHNARLPAGEPPLVRAIAAPYKIAPEDPGGRQFADQGEINRLLRDDARPAQPERVLPLPEEPRAPIIVAAPREPAQPQTPADAGDASAAAEEAGPPAADDATREAEAALARLLTDVGTAGSADEPAVATEQAAIEPAVAAPAAPSSDAVARPAMRPAAPPASTAPTSATSDPQQEAAPASVPSREADEALTRLLAEVAGVPAAAAPEPPTTRANPPPGAVAAIAPADPAAARSTAAGYRVQLAAVREQEDARRAWASLVERLGPLVADHQPVYERAETVNGVFYRVQLGPFASAQAADRLCAEVQRRNASCFVVGP